MGGGRSCLGFLFGAILAGCVQNGSLAQRKAPARSLGRDRRGCLGSGAPVASPGASWLPPALGGPRGPRDSPSSAREKTTQGGGRPDGTGRDGTGRDGGAGVALAMVLHRPRPCRPSVPPAGRTAPLPLPPWVTPTPGKAGTSEEPGHQAGPELFNVIAQKRVRCLPLFYVLHV